MMNHQLTHNLIEFVKEYKIQYTTQSHEHYKDENNEVQEYELTNRYRVEKSPSIELNFSTLTEILIEKYNDKQLTVQDVMHPEILKQILNYKNLYSGSIIEGKTNKKHREHFDSVKKTEFYINFEYSDFSEHFNYFLKEKNTNTWTKDKPYSIDSID